MTDSLQDTLRIDGIWKKWQAANDVLVFEKLKGWTEIIN